MVSLDQSESSLKGKEMETSPTKRMLAPPNLNKRKAWESIVENAVEFVDSNDELKSSLQRIGQAEKIPIKWNRLKKSEFLTFLNNISGYQVNPTTDEQSWELFSKALENQRKNRAENATIQIEAKKNEASVEIVNKRKGDTNSAIDSKKMKKESKQSEPQKIEKISESEAKKMAKILAKKRAQEKKQAKYAQWRQMIQGMIPEAGKNEALIRDLQRVSNAPNVPHKSKWDKLIRPHFMSFLMNIPAYSVNPTTTDELWTLVSKALKQNQERKISVKTQLRSAKVPKINIRKEAWIALLKNIIIENTDSALTSNLERISQAVKFPRYLNKLNQQKFMSFLNTIPEYQTNAAVDEKLWNLFSKALNERKNSIALNANAIKEEESGTKTDNCTASENGNKKKKKHQTEESKSQVNGTSNLAGDTSNPSDQSVKVKWCTIGKQILRAQNEYELPLKKFQKQIVREYLKQSGGSGDNESVETLWSKCHKKLSKNAKFHIVADKIKLVS